MSDTFADSCTELRDWLIDSASTLISLDAAFLHVAASLGEILKAPRISLAILPTHDIIDGVHYIWTTSAPDEVRHIRRPAGFLEDREHLASPLETVMRSCQPLHVCRDDAEVISKYPFLVEQFGSGVTEYVAFPLQTRRNLVHILTAMTRAEGGWGVDVCGGLARVAPAMGVVTEIFEVEHLLREKETLLREVHHRVKNNLQIVGSLLAMQRSNLKSEEARRALQIGEDRVRAIVAVHRHIYSMRDLAAVQLEEYIAALVGQLVQTVIPARRSRLRLAPLVVRVDDAFPLGLIVNELVTNALQHGTLGSEHDLEVELVPLPDGARLTVRNPSPALEQAATSSLGLQLVRTLARQLRGAMSLRYTAEGMVEAEVSVCLG